MKNDCRILSYPNWLKTVKRYEKKPALQLDNRGFSCAFSMDIEWGEKSADIVADYLDKYDIKGEIVYRRGSGAYMGQPWIEIWIKGV